MFIRMDVTLKEPTGRTWKEIMCQYVIEEEQMPSDQHFRALQVDLGGCLLTAASLPRYWIDPQKFSSISYSLIDRKSAWRRKILADMTLRNELIWNAFYDFCSAIASRQ